MNYAIILYIFFGILPSLVWLLYYASKDNNAEPKKAIVRIFLWGALITIPVFFIQLGLTALLNLLSIGGIIGSLIYWFFVVAFVEELFKFFVVKFKVLNKGDLDEPFDVMLYMVVSALGFAALENVLYLFGASNNSTSFEALIKTVLLLSLVRFIGATFLHTLCSAVVGYFSALEAEKPHKKFYSTEMGLLFATALHGSYDLLIIRLANYQTLFLVLLILVTFGFLTFIWFEKLKRMKGITMVEV